ncbi:phage tail tape measure protein, TP901 family, core region [Marinobacter segnicrescens]|uniref:Phage tail tape measure protein, TP901 family, core region n=1 Tax=Marinobacter segnicrescens TaxID=430453 RepID=A0A1I0H884_9GAMM|nr:phage tail tape measure protein [Marinobacter segnicrescens]SET79912.1 phage tail tape measure protein, TP901 family, core region [Marinobacter segnicrescens]
MATPAKSTVEIVFGAVDKTGNTINGITGKLDGLRGSAESIVNPVAGVTDGILKLDAAIAAVAITAGAYATNQAIKLESAMTDLQKVLSEGQFAADYKDQLIELSNQFGVSSDMVTQSAADFVQTGYTIEESLYLVEQSLLGVNAADLAADQSTQILIRSLKGFGAEADQAGRLMDVLNATSNKYAVTVDELGNGMAVIAPLAQTMGLSFEEITALLTPMIEITQSGSESANALKTVMSNLIKPTKEQAQVLRDELGIQLEVNGQRRNAADILSDIIEKSGSLTDVQKQYIAATLGGAEQASRFSILLGTSAKQSEVLENALNSSGSAMEEFEVKTSSTEFALKQLQTAFNNTAANIGGEYIKETQGVTRATTELLESISTAAASDNADQLFEVMRGALQELEGDIYTLAENLPEAFANVDLSGLLDAFGVAGQAIDDIFDIDVSDPEALSEAIQFVVDSLESLTRVSTEIFKEIDEMVGVVVDSVDAFNKSGTGAKEFAGEILGMAKQAQVALGVLGGVTDVLGGIGTGLTLIGGAQLTKAVTGLSAFDKIKPMLGGAATAVSSLARAMGPLGIALTAVSAGFAYAYKENEKFREGVQITLGLETDHEKQAKLTAKAIEDQGKAIRELREQYESGKISSEEYSKAVTDITGISRDWAESLDGVRKANGELVESSAGVADAAKKQGEELGKTSDATEEASKKTDKLADGQKKLGDAAGLAADSLGVARTELEALAFDDKLRLVEVAFDIQSRQLEQKLEFLKTELSSVSEMFSDTGDVIVDMFDQLGKRDGYDSDRLDFLDSEIDKRNILFEQHQASLEMAREELAAQGELNGSIEGMGALLELAAQKYQQEFGGSLESAIKKTGTLIDETGKVVDEQDRATKSVEDFKIKLDEVSAGVYKAAVELDIARAETALKTLESAAEQTMNTISSTEKVIGKVVEGMDGAGFFDRLKFNDILDAEMEIRKETAKTAKEIAQSQIEQANSITRMNNARAEAFESGYAQIQVNADGLAPELGLVLEKLIQLAHVEASEEGINYLLGS